MVILGWEIVDWILHCKFSHAGSIKTTRKGFEDNVEQASACNIVSRMASGSYSGLDNMSMPSGS